MPISTKNLDFGISAIQTSKSSKKSKYFGLTRRESQKDERLETYFNKENFENVLKNRSKHFPEEINTPRKFQKSLQTHFEKSKGMSGMKQRKFMRGIQKSLKSRKSQVNKLMVSNYENPVRYSSQLKYYDRLLET
jgi:hypothetical protein